MSEVPDKVIEQATRAAFMAGDDQEQYVHGFAPDDFEPWRWSSSELMSSSEATVAAAAPVIAKWAREQGRAEGAAEERAIVKALVHRMRVQAEHDCGDAEIGGRRIMQTLYAGKKTGLDAALAALDREEPA